MSRLILTLFVLFGMIPLVTAHAVEETPAAPKAPTVKYTTGKDVDFEKLLIQGEIKQPEVSIVTGNIQQGTDGLLRLRENFTDRISMDGGEELQ